MDMFRKWCLYLSFHSRRRFSGVISDLGEELTEFRVGDEVYGNAGALLVDQDQLQNL